jgi:hypothetical protein
MVCTHYFCLSTCRHGFCTQLFYNMYPSVCLHLLTYIFPIHLYVIILTALFLGFIFLGKLYFTDFTLGFEVCNNVFGYASLAKSPDLLTAKDLQKTNQANCCLLHKFMILAITLSLIGILSCKPLAFFPFCITNILLVGSYALETLHAYVFSL